MKGIEILRQKYPNSITVMQDFEMVSVTHLLMAHSTKYYEKLQNSVPSTDEPQHVTQYSSQPDTRTEEDFDTYMSSHSLQAACYAAGSICCAIDQVNSTKTKFYPDFFFFHKPRSLLENIVMLFVLFALQVTIVEEMVTQKWLQVKVIVF